jgi:hypothetical protein
MTFNHEARFSADVYLLCTHFLHLTRILLTPLILPHYCEESSNTW